MGGYGMVGDYTSMAEAVGEKPMRPPAFVAGIDYDGADPDEVEVVRLATETHRYERLRELEDENRRLRDEIARLHRRDEEDE